MEPNETDHSNDDLFDAEQHGHEPVPTFDPHETYKLLHTH